MLFDSDSFPQFHGNLVGILNSIFKSQFLKSNLDHMTLLLTKTYFYFGSTSRLLILNCIMIGINLTTQNSSFYPGVYFVQ